MCNRELSELIQKANNENVWVSKEIYLRFNEEQYQALLKGYQPHWDMRYGIYFENGYFYNYRSGFIVGKFKVEKMDDDFYQVTEIYDNPEKNDWRIVFDSLREACYQNKVDLDFDLYVMMCEKTYELNE
jgi:hypothetical protein